MSRVLVTAGGSGIGLAMGHAFADVGHDIWITDVDAAALDAAPKSWKRTHVDASNETEAASLFSKIETEWGGLDVLCRSRRKNA